MLVFKICSIKIGSKMIKKIKNTASCRVYLYFQSWQTRAHHVIFPKRSNYQNGFIPLVILLLLLLVGIIFAVYLRVHKAQG
jgi:hypothetical protein